MNVLNFLPNRYAISIVYYEANYTRSSCALYLQNLNLVVAYHNSYVILIEHANYDLYHLYQI